jgi:hypothetical protein
MRWRRERKSVEEVAPSPPLGTVRIHVANGQLIDIKADSASRVSEAYQQAMCWNTVIEIEDPNDGRVLRLDPRAILYSEDLSPVY